ncbi:hypothetical protein AB7M49_006099 [Bradyrhizobium elkanii]
MNSIQPNCAVVTPVYVGSREFTRRVRHAYPDPTKCLQIALDVQAGRLVVLASRKYIQRVDAFVAMATGVTVSASRYLH